MPVCRLYLIFNVIAKPQSFFVGAVFAGVAVCPDTAGSADPGAHRLYLFFAAVMFAAPVAAVMGYCDNGPSVFVAAGAACNVVKLIVGKFAGFTAKYGEVCFGFFNSPFNIVFLCKCKKFFC